MSTLPSSEPTRLPGEHVINDELLDALPEPIAEDENYSDAAPVTDENSSDAEVKLPPSSSAEGPQQTPCEPKTPEEMRAAEQSLLSLAKTLIGQGKAKAEVMTQLKAEALKYTTTPMSDATAERYYNEALQRSVFTGRELLDIDLPKPIPIVDGLFFEGKDSIMGGAYGIGKTTASLHMGIGIAAGEAVFELRVTRPYRTLYIDLELGISEFKERYRVIQALCRNQERLHENFVYVDASPDSTYSGKLKFDGGAGSTRILELTNQFRAEFVIVDNLSLVFVGDLENSADCMRLRERVSEIKRRNPLVRSFFFPTHLTKPDPEHTPSLLHDPRQWLRRIRGSGKLLDHFTIRLGLDSVNIDGNEVQVLNGISSHGRISPICLERVCDEEEACPPYLKPHSDSELKAKTILTVTELEFWKGLPSRFRSADIKAHAKHATGFRMLTKAKDNGLVAEVEKGVYIKVG